MSSAKKNNRPFADGSQVAPNYDKYTKSLICGELWERPGLSDRDKTMLTCAVLIAMNNEDALPYYFALALDKGLTARELSEVVTQLAVYCGWPAASNAVEKLGAVYAERGIGGNDIEILDVDTLEPDPDMELSRARVLQSAIGQVSPPLAEYSNRLLFGDLWLQPELAPRDRSFVTLAAIWAMGLQPLLDYQYSRAFDNGVTEEELSNALVHCAFYIGWPRAMAAAMVLADLKGD